VAEEGFAWLAGGHAGMDETDAFGKGEKGQRVTKPNSPARKTPHGAGLGAAKVECEDRSFEALYSLKMTIFSG
jgi:hypothetical protein